MKSIFDTSSLIDFLSAKRARATYDYYDGSCCLITQYLHWRGFKDASVDAKCAFLPSSMGPYILPDGWDAIAWEHPWTFGAALERARKAFAESRKVTGRSANVVIVDELDEVA